MADYEIMGPYLVALLMGMGCAVHLHLGRPVGRLEGADEAALKFYRAEMANDRTTTS